MNGTLTRNDAALSTFHAAAQRVLGDVLVQAERGEAGLCVSVPLAEGDLDASWDGGYFLVRDRRDGSRRFFLARVSDPAAAGAMAGRELAKLLGKLAISR